VAWGSWLANESPPWAAYRAMMACRLVALEWMFLKDDKCHYYVCRDSNMAEDVYDELFLTANRVGNLSHKESWSVFQKMKREHRFQADTWGVVSNREEGLAKQAEKKYNQAALWLKSVQASRQC
jgi:hypothetical protein